MTRKVLFLPGMGSRNGAHSANVIAKQFRRVFCRWAAEMAGIWILNVWFRGSGNGRRQRTICVAINVAANVSALDFIRNLKKWVADQPYVELAERPRYGKPNLPKDGDNVTVIFRVREGDGRVRLRPVRRGSRSRQKLISVITTRPLQPEQQEPAGALVV